MEIWKPMLGFENHYEVSNLGRGRRTARGKKLNATSVDDIKAMLAAGKSMLSIAKIHRVSVPTISMIRDGITWNGDHGFRMLKPHLRTDFYYNFQVCVNRKMSHYTVHRAVWEAFNGKIENQLQINHKDLDRSNNRLDNLELATCEENIRHAIEHYQRTQGTHQTGGKYHSQKVALREKRAAKKLL